CEPNYRYQISDVTGDPLATEQWYLQTIHADLAHDIEMGDASVLVGVIDTGVDFFHEDLLSSLWINTPEDINGNGMLDSLDIDGIDQDGNGYPDDVIGWDFTDAPLFPDNGDYMDPDPFPMDEFTTGHGTVVAGIIAATTNNGVGVSGIAPGVKIMALRAGTASGFLEEDDVAEAILYAIENHCDIINMSFGDVSYSFLLHDVIEYGTSQGVLFIAAAGNNGSTAPNYPAAYDETISVGATNEENILAGFSNYGNSLSLVAPGVNIFSTRIGDEYGSQSGTSFAAPMVTAAAALIKSHQPEANREDITGAILSSCNDLGLPGWDIFYGHGLLNIVNALQISNQGFAHIISPSTTSGVSQNLVPILGTAMGGNLLSYTLKYGMGESPINWETITEVEGHAVINDTLGIWDTANLVDTSYTLELRVKQFQQNDLIHRVVVYVDHTPPLIIGLDTLSLYLGAKRGKMIRISTDEPAQVNISFRRKGDTQFILEKQSPYFRREHFFLLSQEDLSGELEFFITLENAAGLETIDDNNGQYYPLFLNREYPDQRIISQRETSPFRGYFSPQIVDINHNQQPELIISRFVEEDNFGPLAVLEFLNGDWSLRLETEFPAIPRDVGVVQPDGGEEILAGFGNLSLLLGGNTSHSFPNKVTWSDTTDLWGSRLVNIDNDSSKELLGLKGGIWKIFEFNSSYDLIELQTLQDSSLQNSIYGVPWAEVADVDRDGDTDIFFDVFEGNIYRFEQTPDGTFQKIWSGSMKGRGGMALFKVGDVTGDSLQELITVGANVPETITESNAIARYWTITIWEPEAENSMNIFLRDNIHSVTIEPGVQNGLSIGDLNNDGKDEIILSLFPNLYVFGVSQSQLELLWFAEGFNSNSPLVYDLDGNGLMDVLVNSNTGIQRFESSLNENRPAPPVGLSAIPMNTQEIQLEWVPNGSVEFFNIYRAVENAPLNWYDSTRVAFYRDVNVEEGVRYRYVVTQIDSGFQNPESRYSPVVEAIPNDPPQVERISGVTSRQLILQYSEPMEENAFDVQHYELTNGMHPGSAIRGSNRQEVLLSFVQPLDFGEHVLKIFGVSDLQRTPLTQDTLYIPFQVTEEEESFYANYVQLISKNRLLLEFSQKVDTSSALNPMNYQLSPDDRVIEVEIDPSSPKRVWLTLTGENRMGNLGVPYYLTVQNVKSWMQVPLASDRPQTFLIKQDVSTLKDVLVYPNPYDRTRVNQPLIFAHLPQGSEVFIFSSSGEFLRKLDGSVISGGLRWDLRNEQGEEVGSGVYVYIVRHNGVEKKGKILIVN
ncbi:MAG: hypothetical protein D6748_07155, partial [Calditrichaeota bacterium]